MKALLKKLRWKWHRDITELSTGQILEKLNEIIAFWQKNLEKTNYQAELAEIIPLLFDILNCKSHDDVGDQILSLNHNIRERRKGFALAMLCTCAKDPLDNIVWSSPDLIRTSTLGMIAREIEERKLPGAVAELGVAYGDFAAVINTLFPTRTFYMFDTFDGFPERDLEHDRELNLTYSEHGTYSGINLDIVMNKMRYPEQCVVRKGYFPDTTNGLEEEFVYVDIDCDLYLPIKAGLEYFYPRMVQGGCIFVHDYNNGGYLGTKKALREFSERTGTYYVVLPDGCGTAILIKS